MMRCCRNRVLATSDSDVKLSHILIHGRLMFLSRFQKICRGELACTVFAVNFVPCAMCVFVILLGNFVLLFGDDFLVVRVFVQGPYMYPMYGLVSSLAVTPALWT
jgi:hypothetical protein